MRKVTVGVIGLGSIARKAHLPVLTADPNVEIVALCSRTGARVAEMEEQYRLRLKARTFSELLAVRPEAAYLLSTTTAHAEQAVQLLEAGIAVYLEKPLAPDLPGATQVADAVSRTGGLLMVGFNRRYAPAYRRARELFAGRPLELVQIHKHRNRVHPEWDLRQIVMDDAIHIIDLARFFGGGDLRLQASHARLGLTVAQMVSPGGVLAQISQSYGAGSATERLELHGGGLSVIVEEMERLRILADGVERVETVGGSWTSTLEKRGMAPATAHFLACLRDGLQPETPAADALRTQELAEAILA